MEMDERESKRSADTSVKGNHAKEAFAAKENRTLVID